MNEKTAPYGAGKIEFIALMALITAVFALSVDAMLPALGEIGDELNATGNQGQLIVGMLFFGAAIGQFVGGILSDGIGRRKTVLGFMIVFFIGTALCILAQTMPQMLLGRVIQGFGAAGPQVVVMAIVRDRFEGRFMAQIMSYVMSVFILVPIIAPLLGQTVLFFATWRAIFVLLAVLAAILLIWFMIRQPETLTREGRLSISPSSLFPKIICVLGVKRLLIYTCIQGLILGAFVGYLVLAQPIFQDLYGLEEWFPVLFAALSITIGAGSILNGSLVVNFGMRRLMAGAYLIILLISVPFLLWAWAVDGDVPLLWFLIWMGTVLFLEGLAYGNVSSLALEPLGDQAGIGATVFGGCSMLITMLMGTMIGQLFDHSVAPVALGFCIATGVGLCLIWIDGGSPWRADDPAQNTEV